MRGVGPVGSDALPFARAAAPLADAVGSSRGLRDLQTGHEAFEVALLLWLEITRHRVFRSFTTLMRPSRERCALLRGNTRRRRRRHCGGRRPRLVGHVDGKPREGESADQIAERHRDLIP